MSPDAFYSIAVTAEFEFREKASRFLGFAYPARSEEECAEHLQKLKKRFYDATHHTYAYQLADGQTRAADDGEPSGTAGMRILHAFQRREIRNVFCAVVRYFGGTKLGVGPLGKAYAFAAEETLALAPRVEVKRFYPAVLNTRYDDIGSVYHAFSLFPLQVGDTSFSAGAEFSLLLPYDCVDAFTRELDRMLEARYTLRLRKDEAMYQQV